MAKLKNGDTVKVVNDQIGTPTDARLILKIIKKILITKAYTQNNFFI